MKKKIGDIFFIWLFFVGSTFAQFNQDRFQYWWNDDLDAKIEKVISGSVQIEEIARTNDQLSDGFYRLNYRVKDNRDNWGQTITSLF